MTTTSKLPPSFKMALRRVFDIYNIDGRDYYGAFYFTVRGKRYYIETVEDVIKDVLIDK